MKYCREVSARRLQGGTSQGYLSCELPVIQSSLKPLPSICLRRGGVQTGQLPAERAHTLRSHGIPFIRHGGTTYLILLEWLLQFFAHCEKSDVGSDALTRASKRCKNICYA